jgi:hypothetical protein
MNYFFGRSPGSADNRNTAGIGHAQKIIIHA